MELETINKLYLELSQVATATTERERKLRIKLGHAKWTIIECAKTFRGYEVIHKAKGTPAGDSKAKSNGDIAKELEEFARSL